MKKTLIVLVLAVVALLGALVGIAAVQKSRQLAVAPIEPRAIDDGAPARLARAIRFPTLSHQDPARFDGAPFLALHAFLETAYPRVHQTLRREAVNDFSLLYTWPGSAPELAPVVLLAHLDVVPVEPGAKERWSHGAFAGDIAEGFIWGRSSLDDKVSVLGILEAAEHLLAGGFEPRRTVLLAFGHDEEVGGGEGAAQIAALLGRRGGGALFTLDEGLVITEGLMPGVARPVALIGLAEKGYVTLELIARAPGGHSSMPLARTAIGALAAAIAALDENPMAARIEGAAAEMFAYVALIPKGLDIGLFHRRYFARSQGAACAVVLAHHKQAATPRAGKRTRPPVGRLGLPEDVAPLARCPASGRATRLPGRPMRRHETGQYQGPLV